MAGIFLFYHSAYKAPLYVPTDYLHIFEYMKKLLYIFTLPLLLLACGDVEKTGTPKDIKATFMPIVNGTWVMEDYFTELEKTNSPKLASEKLKGIVSMDINTSDIQGDSLVVSASWNNHEGYVYHLFFRQGQDEQSLVTTHPYSDNGTDFYELAYTVDNNDTLLVMKLYGKDKKLKEQRRYVKVTGPQADNSEPYGIQYVANKVLLSGKYTATDSNGISSTIEMTDDGMVTGFGKHTTYYIYTDFLGAELTNLDEMSFDAFTKTQKPYIFEIAKDTVYLYQALENEERTLLIRGPLKYTLIKQ